ncbi:hypothetical protein ACPWT1_00055 [Ramlibacter sp. MMS24-I3-19]|uniref:hypothetical protein n=1 Tax=Ramlibacter sp. MMS24-I3-19 TaxID=3416606 RepID=UPI003D07D80D
MSAVHEQHIPLDVLLQDWLGEVDPVVRDTVDAHLMACDACGELLDDMVALGTGVRQALRAGAITLIAGADFLQRLAARGARIREYRLPHNGSVNCTVAPGDDVLAGRVQVPLDGVQRLDLVMELSSQPGVLHRVDDIPFDAQADEVLFLPAVAQVRQMPAHTLFLTLLSHEDSGSRELGRYEFRHTPWGEAGEPMDTA